MLTTKKTSDPSPNRNIVLFLQKGMGRRDYTFQKSSRHNKDTGGPQTILGSGKLENRNNSVQT